jgi:TolA-binding protein
MRHPLLSLLCTLVVVPATLGQNVPVSDAEHLLDDVANDAFEAKDYPATIEILEKFLTVYPRSTGAPAAAYRLGTVYLLQGKEDQARKAFERLMTNYSASPWAELTLRVHFNEQQFIDAADVMRLKGRKPDGAADALRAIGLYEAYTDRFIVKEKSSNARSREELLYKIADCYRCAGQAAVFREGMQAVLKQDPDGNWGKLAALRLGRGKPLAEMMDELIRLDNVGTEACIAFLDMAAKTWNESDGDAAAKCLYYRAHCHEVLDEKDEARELYRQIVKEHPLTTWAADSAFWLAEADFNAGRRPEARDALLALAKDYPKAARATQAAEWAAWLGQSDETSKDLERLLADVVARLNAAKGLAFRLTVAAPGQAPTLEARCAFRDGEHFLLAMRRDQRNFLLAGNAEGAWYRAPDQAFMAHSKAVSVQFWPQLIGEDNAKDLSFRWNCTSEDNNGAPLFRLAPTLAHTAVAKLGMLLHLGKEARPGADGRLLTVFRLEAPQWERPEPLVWELVFDERKALRAVRHICRDNQGKPSVWTVSDLALAETLAEERFEVALPKGLLVREVDEIPAADAWMDGLKILSAIVEEATHKKK